MAGTYTIKHQTVQGDMRIVYYAVTNFTNAETITVPGMREIYHSQAQVAATADKVIALSNVGNVITTQHGEIYVFIMLTQIKNYLIYLQEI